MTLSMSRITALGIVFLITAVGCSDGCGEPEEADEEAPQVERLHFGTYHVCTLDDNAQIWCTGDNAAGQLGDGTTTKRSHLTEVVDLGPMTGLAVGYFDTSCAWNDEGELFCWGNHEQGVLGNADEDSSTRPVRIEDLPPIIDVTLGAYHACALTEAGTVYCWGSNRAGQLGVGTGVGPIVDEPQKLEELESIQKIRAGGEHTCALDQQGTIYCWGNNDHGQLGLGELPGTTTPEVLIEAPEGALDLEVSFRHSCALFGERRELYCWGNNDYGQFGLDDLESRSTPVEIPEIAYVDELAVGGGQICARIDDEVFCAGEVLRPVEVARQTGEGYFFTPSQALEHTTEMWSGVLAICGAADDRAIACRGVQHQDIAGDLF